MNSQGGRAGQVNPSNTNNQNFTSHPSLESLQTAFLPLFPLTTESGEMFLDGLPQPNMNLPRQDLIGVPFFESPNISLGSNIYSSSIARTPQNPSTNLDLSLTIGLVHQGHEMQVQGVDGSTSSNNIFLPSKRSSNNHESTGFFVGESSNMRQQAPSSKRHVIEFHVDVNNNLNPSPPLPERQVSQLLSANPPNEPTQDHGHVNPHNESAPTLQPRCYSRLSRIANNFRRAVQGQLQHFCFSCSGSSHHNLPPLPSLHRSSMNSPLSTNNGSNMSGHNAHQPTMNQSLSEQATRETGHSITALQHHVDHEIFLPRRYSNVDIRRILPAEVEDLFIDFSLPSLDFEMDSQDESDPAHLRLSVDSITGRIQRENFMSSVDIENPDDEEKCSICLEVYEDGDEIGKLDLCVHRFHVQCIKQWLKQKNVCPICKRTALTMNSAQNEVGAADNNENFDA